MSPPGALAVGACDECLARAWLLARLAGHLDQVRGRVAELLTLPDPDLIAAVGGAPADGDRVRTRAV